MGTEKSSFPTMSTSHWWTLRKQFCKTIPGIVTPDYLSTVLNMKIKSARTNVLPTLRIVKLIDENGKTGDMAKKWRDDGDYPQVCETIKGDIYPQELFDSVPNPLEDRDATTRWFSVKTGAGQEAVRRMVLFYLMLCEADPVKQSAIKKIVSQVKKEVVKVKKIKSKKVIPRKNVSESNIEPATIHINLQIHISADSSSEQIDQIFLSIAKHIYKSRVSSE
jgi:hypothetical protein